MYYFNVIVTVIHFLIKNHIVISYITFITSKSDLKKVFSKKFF
jgi:hypothetical protein